VPLDESEGVVKRHVTGIGASQNGSSYTQVVYKADGSKLALRTAVRAR
jgi:hypothetical protein